MHSSRMRTARSLAVSHRKKHARPPIITTHAPLPPGATTHAPPGATMHTPPEQPCMPPRSNHTCPPGATMHAPPGATMHTPLERPCMPPRATTHTPGATTHAPWEQPRTPPCEQPRTPPPGQTDTCKNITFANFVCGGKRYRLYFPGIYDTFTDILCSLLSSRDDRHSNLHQGVTAQAPEKLSVQ